MEYKFIDFWHLYAPQKEFRNRYQCCERVWKALDERKKRLIMLQLEKEHGVSPLVLHKKNPYFFLTDWEPPQPHWLTPAETGYLLAQRVPLAVCRNPKTQRFGTVTKEDAEQYGLEVHHWM